MNPTFDTELDTTSVGKWVSVKDKLPEKGSRILLYDCNEDGDGFGVLTGRYSDGGWYLEGELSRDATITHWMPLPIPPIIHFPKPIVEVDGVAQNERAVALVRQLAPLARIFKENRHTGDTLSDLINLVFWADTLFPEETE